jgi:hypothetical protein
MLSRYSEPLGVLLGVTRRYSEMVGTRDDKRRGG